VVVIENIYAMLNPPKINSARLNCANEVAMAITASTLSDYRRILPNGLS
jgi:multidrug efflux pump subunit AcrB